MNAVDSGMTFGREVPKRAAAMPNNYGFCDSGEDISKLLADALDDILPDAFFDGFVGDE
jgi:hypothetical protein